MAGVGKETEVLSATFDGNAAPFFQAAANVGRAIGGMIASLRGVQIIAAATIVAVSAGIFVATRKALIAAASLDAALREVSTLTNTTAENMEFLRVSLLRLSTTVPSPPELLSQGLYQVISAGITETAAALQVLGISAKAAVAGLTDTFTGVDAITTLLNAYQLSASQAGRVSDVLFTTVKEGKVTFPQLAQAIGNVATSAGIAGVTVEELGAAIATLTKFGLNARKATTALNSLLVSILNPTKEVAEAAERMGIQWNAAALDANGLSGVLSELRRVTGGAAEKVAELVPAIRSFRAAAVLGGKGQAEFNRILIETEDAAGATLIAFEKMNNSLSNQTALLKNQINKFWADLGDKILPNVLSIVRRINENLIDPRDRVADLLEMAGNVEAAFRIRKETGLELLNEQLADVTLNAQNAAGGIDDLFSRFQRGIPLESPSFGGGTAPLLTDPSKEFTGFFNRPELKAFFVEYRQNIQNLTTDIELMGDGLQGVTDEYGAQAQAVLATRNRLQILKDFIRNDLAVALDEITAEGIFAGLTPQERREINNFGLAIFDLVQQLESLLTAQDDLASFSNFTFEEFKKNAEKVIKPLTSSVELLELAGARAQRLADAYALIGDTRSRNAIIAQAEADVNELAVSQAIIQRDALLSQVEKNRLFLQIEREKLGIQAEALRLIKEMDDAESSIAESLAGIADHWLNVLDVVREVDAIGKLDSIQIDAEQVAAFAAQQERARDIIRQLEADLESYDVELEQYIKLLELSENAGDRMLAGWLRWLTTLANVQTETKKTEQEIRDLVNSVGQGARAFLQFAQAIGTVSDEVARLAGSMVELGVNLAEIIKLSAADLPANPLATAGALGAGLNLLSSAIGLFGESEEDKKRRLEAIRIQRENTKAVEALSKATVQLAAIRDLRSSDFGTLADALRTITETSNLERTRISVRINQNRTDLEEELAAIGVDLDELERIANSVGIELSLTTDSLHLLEGQLELVDEALRKISFDALLSTFEGAQAFADLSRDVFDIKGFDAEFDDFRKSAEATIPGIKELAEGLDDAQKAALKAAGVDVEALFGAADDPDTIAAWEALSRFLIDNFGELFKAGFFGFMTPEQAQAFVRAIDEFTDTAQEAEIADSDIDAITAVNKITTEQGDILIALTSTQVFYLSQIAQFTEQMLSLMDGGLEAPTFEELNTLKSLYSGPLIGELNIDVDISGVDDPTEIALVVSNEIVREVDTALGQSVRSGTIGTGRASVRDI